MNKTQIKTVTYGQGYVEFDWAREGSEPSRFEVEKLPDEIRDKLVLFGLNQKLSATANRAAKIIDAWLDEGRDGDPVLAHRQATDELWESLIGGDWGVERGAGTARPDPDYVLAFRAVMSGKVPGVETWSVDQVREKLDLGDKRRTSETKRRFDALPQVQQFYADLRSKAAADDADFLDTLAA